MKLNVQGIEEIEITDPAGLCNPLVPQLPSQPRGIPGIPPNLPSAPNPFQPQPQIPGGSGDPTIRPFPGTGDVAIPHRPSIYTRHVDDPTKWGVGGEAIQRAGQQVDPDKWQKGWRANMSEEGQKNGNGNYH